MEAWGKRMNQFEFVMHNSSQAQCLAHWARIQFSENVVCRTFWLDLVFDGLLGQSWLLKMLSFEHFDYATILTRWGQNSCFWKYCLQNFLARPQFWLMRLNVMVRPQLSCSLGQELVILQIFLKIFLSFFQMSASMRKLGRSCTIRKFGGASY